MFVTKELLEKKRACKDQLDLFNELFPEGVELTRELILEHAQMLDWDWCADRLLPTGSPRSSVYYLATKQAWAAFNLAIMSAYKTNETYEEYEIAIIPAREALAIARATAFADALGL